jgi:uncharacterized protein with HEPN domain
MNRSDLERLRDALQFAHYARANAGSLSAHALVEAIQPQHAALYDLAVIGETLNKISASVRNAAPDIPWRPFADVRNFIVHAYWQVDLEIIADVVQNRLEPLIEELSTLIAFVERAEP